MEENEKNTILMEGAVQHTLLDPITQRIFLTLSAPSLADNQGDIDRAKKELEKELGSPVNIPLYQMQLLSDELRSGGWKVTVIVRKTSGGWDVIKVVRGHVHTPLYGLAIDVGTTTVVIYLIDMTTGDIVHVEADYNEQVFHGEDILTRIYLAEDDVACKKLHSLLLNTINRLVEKHCEFNKLSLYNIVGAVFAGNTTMIHFLLGLNPRHICMAPYTPVVNLPGFISAREINLNINPDAPVYCLPSAGSYVGGDAVAGILVSGMNKKKEISLLVDIGTNGEIIIGNQDWLVACAGAAGPALEGGVAGVGMRAEPGAVDQVKISGMGAVSYNVIGGGKARGICGSGLIDSLAQLFLAGLVDRAGNFKKGSKFVIVTGAESATGEDIVVTQQDIDNLMRTKGAVSAALELLLDTVGCSQEKLSSFYSAGAFGQYLNLESAIAIGLYPDLPRNRMVKLGNSAGEGARLVLLSETRRQELEDIVKGITYYELNASELFMSKFVSSKFLPHTNLDLFPTVKAKILEKQGVNNTR